MRRRILYPLILVIAAIWIIGFSISNENGGLGALFGLYFIGAIMSLVFLLTFIIYEALHHDLSQILLLRVNLFYKRLIFLMIFTHIIWIFVFFIFLEISQVLVGILFVSVLAIPYFLVLWFLGVNKKIIITDVIKGHKFNIFATILVIGAMVFCIIINTQFDDMSNLKTARFNRILEKTFAENDLDKCVELRKNKEICVRYFAINKKDPNICEEYINYISAESLRMNYIVSQVNNFIDNCKISVEE